MCLKETNKKGVSTVPSATAVILGEPVFSGQPLLGSPLVVPQGWIV